MCLHWLLWQLPLTSVAPSDAFALALQGKGCQQQLQQLKESCAQDPVTQAAVDALLQHGGSQVTGGSLSKHGMHVCSRVSRFLRTVLKTVLLHHGC